jgi:hypothetical protein
MCATVFGGGGELGVKTLTWGRKKERDHKNSLVIKCMSVEFPQKFPRVKIQVTLPLLNVQY